MKQLLDFIPLIVFFAVYKLYDIYAATGALIVATAVQIILTWFLLRKVEKMQLITFGLVTVFGGLTMVLHDPVFIKWKVTAVYALFAVALLISQWMTKTTLVQRMFGKEITLPDTIWKKLNLAWALFFTTCGLVNIYVAFYLPLSVWVNFKVFGLLLLTLAFTLLSGVYIYRHIPQTEQSDNSASNDKQP
ncbi:septation protein A [Plesiomonas shigelloides]|uniref:septation protein A n=1 Tax=Plesiomonas shigelloides TaxID=703 RepID=UPI00267703F0|nr:septation protein A [Plesiomonas shigelloides]